MKIVVGVDGSEFSLRAVTWCAKYAGRLDAEVVAVHAVEMPVYTSNIAFYPVPAPFSAEDRENLRKVVVEKWCAPLEAAKVPFKPVLTEGYPSDVIRTTADAEDADLVVVGRRGRGGFTELMLGSTGHQLADHGGRALVIVP